MSVIVRQLDSFSYNCKMWTLCYIRIFPLKNWTWWLWMICKSTMLLSVKSIQRRFNIFRHDILRFSNSSRRGRSPLRLDFFLTYSCTLVYVLFSSSIWVFNLDRVDFTLFTSSSYFLHLIGWYITIIWERWVNVRHLIFVFYLFSY